MKHFSFRLAEHILFMKILLHTLDFSACQGFHLISPDVYVEIQRMIPEAMAASRHMLTETLRMEAKYAGHIQQERDGRAGKRRAYSFRLVSGFLGLTPEAKLMSYPAFVQSNTMDIVRKRFRLDNAQVLELMTRTPSLLKQYMAPFHPDHPLPQLSPDMCPYPQRVVCNPKQPYRTYDGCCTNLRHPLWGASFQPLARFVPPNYADAVSAPRVSVTGAPLPSARLVSSTIHWDIDRPQHVHTLMLMLFGQFLDHDMSRTAITKLTTHPSGLSKDLEDVECGETGCDVHGPENRACLPIPIPRNDTDFGFGKKEGGCLMFVRSLPVPYSSNCRLGPQEQLNQLTSWLDASHIYGSKRDEALGLRDLRNNKRGPMMMIKHPGGDFKPLLLKDPKFKDCQQATGIIQCFKAGDGRVNENVALTTLHTFYSREHNRIEEGLHRLNPHWGGEKLYQETRRIVTAAWQFVTFNEFLPLILGPQVTQEHGLNLAQHGHWNGYDEEVYPNIGNVFATAAFRFGHTLIQGFLNMKSSDYHTQQIVPLDMTFRFPHLMYKAPHLGCDELMRGFVSDPIQTRDPFITKQVTKHLFAEEPPDGLGTDLMSLNMQRAREHGMPGYNAYREWCGLQRAHSFEDLSNELPHEVINRFKRLYVHVDDIDIFPAGISEKNRNGAMLGPTFTCIIARQFHNLKFGDRFWFENNLNNPYPFTAAQLSEIRKISLARIMCANSDTMGLIQPKVMLTPFSVLFEALKKEDTLHEVDKYNHFYFASHNERVPCDSLPDMDLRAWQEQPSPPPPSPHLHPIPSGPLHGPPQQPAFPHQTAPHPPHLHHSPAPSYPPQNHVMHPDIPPVYQQSFDYHLTKKSLAEDDKASPFPADNNFQPNLHSGYDQEIHNLVGAENGAFYSGPEETVLNNLHIKVQEISD